MCEVPKTERKNVPKQAEAHTVNGAKRFYDSKSATIVVYKNWYRVFGANDVNVEIDARRHSLTHTYGGPKQRPNVSFVVSSSLYTEYLSDIRIDCCFSVEKYTPARRYTPDTQQQQQVIKSQEIRLSSFEHQVDV